MLLSELEFFGEFQKTVLQSLPDGSTLLVVRHQTPGEHDTYSLYHYSSFTAASRAADVWAKTPTAVHSWRNMDALTAQCLLFELFGGNSDDVGSCEQQ